MSAALISAARATRLETAYVRIKHHTQSQKQPDLEHALARIARIALTAALLRRATGLKSAGTAWMQDWQNRQAGEH